MKQAINTRTQEEYDALMRYYEEQRVTWSDGTLASKNDIWDKCREETCIAIGHYWPESLGFDTIDFYTKEGYEIIPYTEFAKANIVEEIGYKAKYEEAVKLLKWSKQICSNIQRTKTYGTKFPETSTLGNAIDDFLNPR